MADETNDNERHSEHSVRWKQSGPTEALRAPGRAWIPTYMEVRTVSSILSSRRLPRHRCDACRVSGARTAVTWLGARKVQVCAHLLVGKPGPAVSR